MSPDPPQVPNSDPSQIPQGGTPLTRPQSSVRTLLGLPDSGEHNSLSAVGMPLVEFSYAASQARAGIESDDPWFDPEFGSEEWVDVDQISGSDRQTPISQPFRTRIEHGFEEQELTGETFTPAVQEQSASPLTSPTKPAVNEANETASVIIPGVTSRVSAFERLTAIPQDSQSDELQPPIQPVNAPDPLLQRIVPEPLHRKEISDKFRAPSSSQADKQTDQTIDNTAIPATGNFSPAPLPTRSPDRPSLTKEAVSVIQASGLMPVSESAQGDLATIAHRSTQRATAQIAQLRQAVAELTAQVAAQQANQQQSSPVFFPPVEAVAEAERSTPLPKASQAFWERRYLNRFYRWSRW